MLVISLIVSGLSQLMFLWINIKIKHFTIRILYNFVFCTVLKFFKKIKFIQNAKNVSMINGVSTLFPFDKIQ